MGRPVKALQKNSIDEQGLGSKILRFQSDWEAHICGWGDDSVGKRAVQHEDLISDTQHKHKTKHKQRKTKKTEDFAHSSATLEPPGR